MEAFILSKSLEANGIKLKWNQKRLLNEVLIFDEAGLSVGNRRINQYYVKSLVKKIRKGEFTPEFLESGRKYRSYLESIRPEEIVRAHYQWDLDILAVTPFGANTEILNPEIAFYRLLHEDASPRVRVHSLWLAIPEVREKLEPYLFPAQGTTTLIKTPLGIFEKGTFDEDRRIIIQNSIEEFPRCFIGDDTLSLGYYHEDPVSEWRKEK